MRGGKPFGFSKIGICMEEMFFRQQKSRNFQSPSDKEAARHTHVNLTKRAALDGFSVFQTSDSFYNGDSQLILGEFIKEGPKYGISREKLFILSGCGLVPDKVLTTINKEELQKQTKHGNLVEEIVMQETNKSEEEKEKELINLKKAENKTFKAPKNAYEYSIGEFSCIDPEYLESQINHILNDLNTNYIDCLLIEHPEYQLLHPKNHKLVPSHIEEKRKELYSSLKQSFEFLESQVLMGKIKEYGIRCDSFGVSENDRNHTYIPYEDIEKILKSISSKHSMKSITLPISLLQTDRIKLAKEVQKSGVKVFSLSPLYSVNSEGEWNLSDYKPRNHLRNSKISIPNVDSIPKEYENLLSYLDGLAIPPEEVKLSDLKEIIHNINNFDSYTCLREFEEFIEDYAVKSLAEVLKLCENKELWEKIQNFLDLMENSVRYVAFDVTRDYIKQKFPLFMDGYNPKYEEDEKRRITKGIHSIEEFAFQYLLDKSYITSVLSPITFDYELSVPSRLLREFNRLKAARSNQYNN